MKEINYNTIAELISHVYNFYDDYIEVVNSINYHSSLINAKLNLEYEELNFTSFDEDYLESRIAYYSKLQEELKNNFSYIFYEVDGDDYK